MDTRKIIAISGKMRSGKDTFADSFIPTAAGMGYDYSRVGFADTLKIEVAEELGITVEELTARKDELRELLIVHGAKRRLEDILYWVKKAIPDEGNVVITDMRFRNEYDYLKGLRSDKMDVYFVRIEALTEMRARRGRIIENDPSETDLDQAVKWDQIIFNNGALKSYSARCSVIATEIVTLIEGSSRYHNTMRC